MVHPGLVGEDDGIGGVFFEWMVLANDVGLGRDEVVIDEKLPGTSQVTHGLGSSHRRLNKTNHQQKGNPDHEEKALVTAHL